MQHKILLQLIPKFYLEIKEKIFARENDIFWYLPVESVAKVTVRECCKK
jgi:hypothetical protein